MGLIPLALLLMVLCCHHRQEYEHSTNRKILRLLEAFGFSREFRGVECTYFVFTCDLALLPVKPGLIAYADDPQAAAGVPLVLLESRTCLCPKRRDPTQSVGATAGLTRVIGGNKSEKILPSSKRSGDLLKINTLKSKNRWGFDFERSFKRFFLCGQMAINCLVEIWEENIQIQLE
ncbi:hypothetical protein H0E87_023413 [Populus deltoides]|uniref:Uncharacterized protein n=1 Tax=Populus deltoides TaxID=3696 RepID=A0A8T2XCH7_POPDE|nr:hypothetical protein H0E87_023413 [Populus deltoides]